MDPQSAVEKAVSVLGLGYDISKDIRLSACKSGPSGSRLIELDETLTRDLVLQGGIVVPNVSASIQCDKGERTRFRSDVLSFNQMSEQFNQEMCLSGKIPSGLFNEMFNFKSCWQKDATATKSLAFDGWFITLYNVELARFQITLSESVKQDVPSTWDPSSVAGFIEKYGTHVIIGVKMGGKDVIHVKQLQKSSLQAVEVQNLLKQSADEKFSADGRGSFKLKPDELLKKLKKDELSVTRDLHTAFPHSMRPSIVSPLKNDIVSIYVRRGGVDNGQNHNQWLSTIPQSPTAISMSFVPITSLLSGVPGSGFLSHAINLYLRYKPPIEELDQFLGFQLPRQWAPEYADLPLGPWRKKHASPSLQFTLLGPKLYINTTKVETGNRPVTGIRLYLEGKKSDHLAIHLQHLSSLPTSIRISDDHTYEPIDEPIERAFFEPVKWSIFSHVCTAPVEYNGAHFDESASIVTKAWLEVKGVGVKKVLFLRLGFSMVASAKIRRSEWDGPTMSSRKSGTLSVLISTRFSTALDSNEKKPAKVDLNSAVFPGGPPLPKRGPKMFSFVDMKETIRGPEDSPGYWVVTGAKLSIEGGKITVKAKYSLLTILSEDSFVI